MRVVLCDYGAGNTRSLELAFARISAEAVTSDWPEDVLAADLAILPGVGSARSAMAALSDRGLDEALRARVNRSRPTLGICLGLQLALESTEEDGGVAGLGLLPGRAARLREGRVPRMGWAVVEPQGEAFYFAHAYAAETPVASGWSEGVVAEARAGSFIGVQFHPEKSGGAGARFLARCLSRG